MMSPAPKTLRRILGYIRPYRRQVTLLVLLMVTAAATELLPPIIMQRIIDDVLIPRAGVRALAVLALGFLGVRLLAWIASTGRGWLGMWLAGRVTADLREHLHQRLQFMPLAFYDRRPVGELLAQATKDTGRLEEFIAHGVPLLAVNGLVLVGVLAYLLSTSWVLTLFALVPVPLMVLSVFSLWRPLTRAWDEVSTSWSRLSARLTESLSGIRVVKAFAQELREVTRIDRLNDEVVRTNVKAERQPFGLYTALYFLMTLGLLLVWYTGGRQVLGARLALGKLLAIVTYLWMFYWPLQWLAEVTNWMGQAFAGAGRIFEVLDSAGEVYEAPGAMAMPALRGQVRFREVTFGYEPGKPVLRGVEFEAAAGETIGLVGKSGAGKTTMMNLLCRFYEVDQGGIEVDGVDLRAMRLRDLREQIAVVLQEPFLFSGTIAENIGYGRPGATFEEVVAAAKVANAHGFIVGKPDGYDTEVGERGGNLSGGERQRIAIARAILRNPKILILDEATSSVDAESEQLIQEAIGRLAQGRTTFIIAHRLSTLRHADRLVVLDAGRVVEVGRYDELMARRGLFFTLVHVQRPFVRTPDRTSTFPMTGPARFAIGSHIAQEPAQGAPWSSPQARRIQLLRGPSGEVRIMIESDRSFLDVKVLRARPLSDPDGSIIILDRQKTEICALRDASELDEGSRKILHEELSRRYLSAVVQRIWTAREDSGATYFEVHTDRGPREFVVKDLQESHLWFGDGRLVLKDVDGNRFEIPDIAQLDGRSVQLLRAVL